MGLMILMIQPESGAGRIALERIRQTNEKGWTLEHDRQERGDGSLLGFAALLLAGSMPSAAPLLSGILRNLPPWVEEAFHHASLKYMDHPERLLEIAGALIAAELDRLTAENDR